MRGVVKRKLLRIKSKINMLLAGSVTNCSSAVIYDVSESHFYSLTQTHVYTVNVSVVVGVFKSEKFS